MVKGGGTELQSGVQSIYRVVQQLEMSPHCIYESENNLAQRLPADMEEKIIKCHQFVLRAQRRHDYQLSHILNMRLEQNSSRFN